jgi:hypothetical protein
VDLPYGKMLISSKLTCTRIDAASGIAIIAVAPEIKIESGEDAAQQVTLNSSSGEGEIHFDFTNGRIAKSLLDLTMDLTVRLNEQQIDQKVSQNLSMVLSE